MLNIAFMLIFLFSYIQVRMRARIYNIMVNLSFVFLNNIKNTTAQDVNN